MELLECRLFFGKPGALLAFLIKRMPTRDVDIDKRLIPSKVLFCNKGYKKRYWLQR